MSNFRFDASLFNRPFEEVFDLPEADPDTPLDFKSFLGLNVYDALELEGGSYTIYNPDGSTDEVEFEGMTLETVIINISQRKNIVRTKVAGRDGRVKEYIGLDDFDVFAYGAIFHPGSKFPEDDLRRLEAIINAPTSIRANSRLLDIFGISHVVVQSYNLQPEQGFNNMQPITIRMASDTPILLDITQTTEL